MSIITAARAYLVDVDVETVRTDALQTFAKQETIFVEIDTDDGLTGTGYSYTIGTGGRAVLSLLQEHLIPLLHGMDAGAAEAVWNTLFLSTKATTVGVVTNLALAAVDTAIWDLAALRAQAPLWKIAGGHRREVPLYDTEGGWLHLTVDDLVRSARESCEAGWHGVKVKIGKPDPHEDLDRLMAIRDEIGTAMHLMVDANQSLSVADAIRRARILEPADLFWLEEPLPAEDVDGHARLAAAIRTPIAVGESVYSLGHFREYLQRGAANIVQVDVARIGGITSWLKVAHLADAFNVDVCPHFLMELHVSLAAAVPNGRYIEHIPHLRAITTTSIDIRDGFAFAPDVPGLGIAWDRDRMDDLRVA